MALVSKDSLKNILHQPGITNTEKLLLCLAVDTATPLTVTAIKEIARSGGLSEVKYWNVSALLRASSGKAVHTGSGWELTDPGIEVVRKIASSHIKTPPAQVTTTLRSHLVKISNQQTAAFVEEAIRCFEFHLYRAAIVLSWVGAVSVLYELVVKNNLSAFNAEARKRDPKWKDAKNADGLALIREREFLDILQAISVIGKSVKEELVKCLELRNGCGHPNSLQIGEHRVSAHIEILILNVFSQFTV